MTAHLQPADAEVIRAVWNDAGRSHADLDLSTIIDVCAAVVDRLEALAGSPPPAGWSPPPVPASIGWAALSGADQQLLTRVRQGAQALCPEATVILFGSRATGLARPDGRRRPLKLPPLPSQCFPPAAAQLRLQSCQLVSFAATFVDALRTNRNAAHAAVQDWCARPRNCSLHPLSPGQRLAFSESFPNRLQLFLDLSRPFDNTLLEGLCGAISKNSSEGQTSNSANVFESRRRAATLSYVTNPFSGLRFSTLMN